MMSVLRQQQHLSNITSSSNKNTKTKRKCILSSLINSNMIVSSDCLNICLSLCLPIYYIFLFYFRFFIFFFCELLSSFIVIISQQHRRQTMLIFMLYVLADDIQNFGIHSTLYENQPNSHQYKLLLFLLSRRRRLLFAKNIHIFFIHTYVHMNVCKTPTIKIILFCKNKKK